MSEKNYYKIWDDYEAIDLLKDVLTADEYIGFLKGNILKYHIRKGLKDDFNKDIIKIQTYQKLLEEYYDKS